MFWMRAKYYRPKKESINSFNHFFLIKFFHKIAENKFYIETLYNFILIKPLQGLSQLIYLTKKLQVFFCDKFFRSVHKLFIGIKNQIHHTISVVEDKKAVFAIPRNH